MDAAAPPAFRDVVATFARIGLLSFGGPAGQIALMHRVLVEEKRWVSEQRFLTALNYCMLLPGPEAQQLATYIGWLLYGWRGGVVAGTLFVIPGLVVILALSAAYAVWHQAGWLGGLFLGLKAAVLAIVVEAVMRVGRRALRDRLRLGIAVAAFLALSLVNTPFPIVIVLAGLFGLAFLRVETTVQNEPIASRTVPRGYTAKVLGVWLSLWILPLILILPLGIGLYLQIFVFFSQMAVVTFGGAYAVLAYVAQEAVTGYNWLNPGEMVDGLALAETTPGPLVLVLSFVGFLAAYRHAAGLDPLLAGLLGGLLVTWVTFVPCFLWIFLGAPHVERLSRNRALAGALSAITAAVVGVIANLALWFALHTLFRTVTRGPSGITLPDLTSADPIAFGLAAVAVLSLFVLRLGLAPTLAICAVLGLGANQLF